MQGMQQVWHANAHSFKPHRASLCSAGRVLTSLCFALSCKGLTQLLSSHYCGSPTAAWPVDSFAVHLLFWHATVVAYTWSELQLVAGSDHKHRCHCGSLAGAEQAPPGCGYVRYMFHTRWWAVHFGFQCGIIINKLPTHTPVGLFQSSPELHWPSLLLP